MPSDYRSKNGASSIKGGSDPDGNSKKIGERIIVRVTELEAKMLDLALKEESGSAKLGKLEEELRNSKGALDSANARIKELTLQIYL
ncbi:MAG: hypothetical protein V3U49_05050 [Nitrososphaerales archaeon]